MGIKERRARERVELKQSILAAAREIAVEQGWQAVTIRKVADLIEYSPPAIYDYFESKEAILQELVREGFQGLVACTRAAYRATTDPDERVIQMAISYCNFAWDQPELFQVMNGLRGTDCHPGDLTEMGEMREMFTSAFRSALPALAEDNDMLYATIDINRATLFGLVSLTMQEQLYGGRARATHLVEQATRQLLLSVRSNNPR